MTLLFLPTLNAMLNGTSAVLLLLGYYSIRQRRIPAHKTCMLLALTSSTFFLISYLIYHWQVGSVRFRGTGIIRVVYFSILSSHTLLAAVIVPLALTTLYRAWKKRFDKHKRIARWTLPIWLYVSITGVMIYWMLYKM
jgi:uncharacterized membrane protein YozB (DUF420 family)